MAKRLTDRQVVARYFRGQLTKPLRSYSDAYVHRLARSAQAQVKAGQKPTRQAARGHAAGREHPPQFVVRKVEGERKRVSTRGVEPTRLGVIVQREYVNLGAAHRWLRGLPAALGVQLVAHGELQPEYTALADEEEPEPDPFGPEGDDDDEGEGERERPEVPKVWRTVYTGNAAGEPDENGVSLYTLDDARAAVSRVFVLATVDAYIVRWQR